jgi:chromosome segregation ATPase
MFGKKTKEQLKIWQAEAMRLRSLNAMYQGKIQTLERHIKQLEAMNDKLVNDKEENNG